MLYITYRLFSNLAVLAFLSLQAAFLGFVISSEVFYLTMGFISLYTMVTSRTIVGLIEQQIKNKVLQELFNNPPQASDE